jgi:hypothetical protein
MEIIVPKTKNTEACNYCFDVFFVQAMEHRRNILKGPGPVISPLLNKTLTNLLIDVFAIFHNLSLEITQARSLHRVYQELAFITFYLVQ